MNLTQWAGKLYSLDTLDTRFTTSAKIPYSETNGSSEATGPSNDQRAIAAGANPSRWRTPEFAVYGFVFLTVVPLMFWTVYDVSQPSHSNYHNFEELLSPGWIPGRKVDNSDLQYSSFRDNVPYLFILLILHPLLRRLVDNLYAVKEGAARTPPSRGQNGSSSPPSRPQDNVDGRLQQRLAFDLIFGLVFLVALHGVSAAKVLIILYINYNIAKKLKREHVPFATWTFNIGILFANELSRGYPFASILAPVSPEGVNWGTALDSYGGLIPRWEVLFNFTVLRLISFNLDYIWSLDQSGSNPLEKKQLDPTNLSERDRIAIPAPPTAYSFPTYLAYSLYSPLYLAGPILTFNDYIAQSRHPSTTISPTRTLLYGLRFLLALFCMELMIHYIYVVAISKSNPDWHLYTPFQLSMLGYFNLHHIWLKLLLPWRFFRWWALTDGIDPPENVVRCMSDNYSTFAFWRGWHRSFNRWLIRYIYIPLGGSGSGSNPTTTATTTTTNPTPFLPPLSHLLPPNLAAPATAIANTLTIFTFVAIWHDIQLRLLLWGWLITLFVLPELLASTVLFPARRWRDRPEAYRVLRGCGAVFNILMMMGANLVGFALGVDGLKGLVAGIGGTWAGVGFLVLACGALFTGAQVMFEVREGERRGGVAMKC